MKTTLQPPSNARGRPALMVHLPKPGGPTTKPAVRARKLEQRWAQVEAAAKREKHAALVRFHAAKRRAAKLLRTPSWADEDAIRAVYLEAQRLTRETGIQHHVDHEIPLQGELVSGLHVHTNLQILTGGENSRKKNRFEVSA